MSQNLYLNEWERKTLKDKKKEFNKILEEKGIKPIEKESEIAHRVLRIALKKAKISEKGSIEISD